MTITTRLKRAGKEIFGGKQWPRREICRPRSYEEQLYQALARPGDVCFDVGAHEGEVSLFLAKLVGESGLVVAFEPVWPIYSELCGQVQYDTTLKARIITVPFGLADTAKIATISVPDGSFQMGSMADASAWMKVLPNATINSYQAQFTTLDMFLKATSLSPPTFMKIDVEGAELFVLQGATELFDKGHRPLMLIEVFAPWERAFSYQPWAPFSWLMARDYRFLFACPTGLVDYLPTEANPFPPDYAMGYNVLAFDPTKHAGRVDEIKHLRAGSLTKMLPMALPPQPNQLV